MCMQMKNENEKLLFKWVVERNSKNSWGGGGVTHKKVIKISDPIQL